MKRFLIGLLAALTLFSLAACGGKENAPPPQEPDQSSGGSNLPNTPDTPDTPDIPDVPDTPDTPETPDIPEVPETPVVPETPETPENQQPETAVQASHTDVTFRVAGDNFRLRPRGMEGTIPPGSPRRTRALPLWTRTGGSPPWPPAPPM